MPKNNVKLKCHFSGIDYESTFLPKGGFMSKNNKSKPLTRHFQIYFKSNHPTYIVDVNYPKIKKPEACRHKVALDTNPAPTLNQTKITKAIKNRTHETVFNLCI